MEPRAIEDQVAFGMTERSVFGTEAFLIAMAQLRNSFRTRTEWIVLSSSLKLLVLVTFSNALVVVAWTIPGRWLYAILQRLSPHSAAS